MSSYNNYMPYNYGYQPNYSFMRPQQPIQPIVQQFVQPFRNVLFISQADVDKRIVESNTAELLIDRDTKTAYIKSADQMGITSTKAYKFEELSQESANEPKNAQISPNFDMSEYVKATDLQDVVKNLEEKIEKLTKEKSDE